MGHTLLIMRHAKSSWKEAALSDMQRPLNGRGKRDAPKMGERLRACGYCSDLIISSPAVRALKTAKKVAAAMGYEGEIRIERALYMAGMDDYLRVIAGVDERVEHLMLVSHNPGCEELMESLTGERVEKFPTAAYAWVKISGRWSELSGGKLLRYDFPGSS